MLQERFSISFAFHHALDSALETLHCQQDLVQSLHQLFLESISQMKVSGEDPVLLLATLSQSNSHLVLDYDNFSLLASFFGWDSPLNLSSTNPRSLTKWLQPTPLNNVPEVPPPAVSSTKAIASSSGLSSSENFFLSSTDGAQGVPNSLFGSSSENSLISAEVVAVADLDDEGVPASEEFQDSATPGLESSFEESRKFFLFLLLILLLTLPSRGC